VAPRETRVITPLPAMLYRGVHFAMNRGPDGSPMQERARDLTASMPNRAIERTRPSSQRVSSSPTIPWSYGDNSI
jgi:hypothetical protein